MPYGGGPHWGYINAKRDLGHAESEASILRARVARLEAQLRALGHEPVA